MISDRAFAFASIERDRESFWLGRISSVSLSKTNLLRLRRARTIVLADRQTNVNRLRSWWGKREVANFIFDNQHHLYALVKRRTTRLAFVAFERSLSLSLCPSLSVYHTIWWNISSLCVCICLENKRNVLSLSFSVSRGHRRKRIRKRQRASMGQYI